MLVTNPDIYQLALPARARARPVIDITGQPGHPGLIAIPVPRWGRAARRWLKKHLPGELDKEWAIAKAITVTELTAGGDTTNQASVVTASITPSSNVLIIVFIGNTRILGSIETVTLSGNGVTWVSVATVTGDVARGRLTMFRAMGAAPSAGAVTITAANSQVQSGFNWKIFEIANVDTGGTNGSAAVVQSATESSLTVDVLNITATLAAFANANNGTVGGFLTGESGGVGSGELTYGTGFTAIGVSQAITSPNLRVGAESRTTNDTTVNASWGTAVPAMAIAAEIRHVDMTRSLAGSQPAAAGVITRIYQALRSTAGNQPAATGTITRIYQALRSLAGNQPAASGILTAAKIFLRTILGNQLAASGVLTRTYQALRSVAGNQPAATGIVTRTAGAFTRALAGVQPAATGTIARIYQAIRSVAGNQPAASGVITRVWQGVRSLAGNQPAASGTVARIYKALRTVAGNQPAASGVLGYAVIAWAGLRRMRAIITDTAGVVKKHILP